MSEAPGQWRVKIDERVAKMMRRLPRDLVVRIDQAIQALRQNPRPRGAKRLQGSHNPALYRVRVGDFRIVYEIRDEELVVLVIRVGPRSGVYRDL